MRKLVQQITFLIVMGTASLGHSHSVAEIQQALGGSSDDIPLDLLEKTRTLDSAAGTNSVREELHKDQHRLLRDHMESRIRSKCADSMTQLSRLDEEIVRSRDERRTEQEHQLREVRDSIQTFLTTRCGSVQFEP